MKQDVYKNFEQAVIKKFLDVLSQLSLEGNLLCRRIDEKKEQGIISGYDYTQEIGKSLSMYHKSVDDFLGELAFLLSKFERYPTQKQFEKLEKLVIQYCETWLSPLKEGYNKCKISASSTIDTAFIIALGNATTKIRKFLLVEQQSLKSRKSIDTIKFCTLAGVILTACSPLVEKIWEQLFNWFKTLFLG